MPQPTKLEELEKQPEELVKLDLAIRKLPQAEQDILLPLLAKLSHHVRIRAKVLKAAIEDLHQATVDNRYLQFDLEATRREHNDRLENPFD